ncbi:Translation machinery-associated protein 16 [Ophiocordyceps camponoti-floridani]|uniref:Translation machinery-associated protein 16 n=1 Tax=Ophiocordyceps camponoti-floridani TaxID=2030778 RepID=A0A8H4Q5A6_9HYPO|nr:Translation machinery-associated protein 16 [Ophiocordyceps camponoti-floridani]
MPNSLQKTRKQIAKKRNGDVTALHGKSRDSLRLHKAGVRDRRLEKLAATRSKKEQPIVDRVEYFQTELTARGEGPLDIATVQSLIFNFIHRFDEEVDALKKARRPGRPPSAREDLLKMRISALEAEFRNGFAVPDVLQGENAKLLADWEGSWSKLTTLPWIKVSSEGHARSCDFPSKGIN